MNEENYKNYLILQNILNSKRKLVGNIWQGENTFSELFFCNKSKYIFIYLFLNCY